MAGNCEGGNEPSGSTKCGKFLDLSASHEGLCVMELNNTFHFLLLKVLNILHSKSNFK